MLDDTPGSGPGQPKFHIHVTPTGSLNMRGYDIEENLDLASLDWCAVCGDRASGKDTIMLLISNNQYYLKKDISYIATPRHKEDQLY